LWVEVRIPYGDAHVIVGQLKKRTANPEQKLACLLLAERIVVAHDKLTLAAEAADAACAKAKGK
jgi:hypothetical protein